MSSCEGQIIGVAPVLTGCTLTGIDADTPLSRLWELHAQYPFVEFGVLYSESQAGAGRYPPLKWILDLAERIQARPGPAFALHVCGRGVGSFLDPTSHASSLYARLAQVFRRLQLNFRADELTVPSLRVACERYCDNEIITQHFPANAFLLQALAGVPNHSVLFDESGGRGVIPGEWPTAPIGKSVGYAGGLGEDCLAQALPRIARAAGGAHWIDMESKLRDSSDRFDVEAAARCLAIVRTHVNSHRG